MILTQTYYSKVSGLVAQRDSQVLEETMALAKSVLKQAHRRGVELEGILEVQRHDTLVNLIYFYACRHIPVCFICHKCVTHSFPPHLYINFLFLSQ